MKNQWFLTRVCIIFGASCWVSQLVAAQPTWWAERGVIVAGVAADDYAVLNLGQLRHLARAARDEMEAKFPGGAGIGINDLVAGWEQPGNADHYAAVNVGQLKAVAQVFYARLIELQVATAQPWAGNTAGSDDFAVANGGQAKNLFEFVISDDLDKDGILNQNELLCGTNPLSADSNGNGVLDPYEDADGDGLLNTDEIAYGLNPLINNITTAPVNLVHDDINRLTRVDDTVQAGSLVQFEFDAEGNLRREY